MALGAAACWAFYILFGKRAARVDGKVAVATGMTVAALLTLPFGVVAENRLTEVPVWVYGFAVALLSSTIPYLLEMGALGRLSSRVFGVVTSSAPAIAALVGFAVLGERLSLVEGTAIAMMVAASGGCTLTAAKPSANVSG